MISLGTVTWSLRGGPWQIKETKTRIDRFVTYGHILHDVAENTIIHVFVYSDRESKVVCT